MLGIHKFFEKINGAFGKEIVLRSAISNSVKKIIGADVKIEDITVKNEIAELKNVSQTVKSVIFTKMPKVLEEINNSQNIKKIKRII